MYYQVFNGASPDEYKVTISVKDAATQKVFDEVVYPDDLEGEEEARVNFLRVKKYDMKIRGMRVQEKSIHLMPFYMYKG